ncbi:hypothetical protein [Bradyrhizobium sp.]|jgi:hypothetical protein|uniref:hypothetical protein n=1 Tax=Bradyrhizobium sp. TaxID=376 RepID=UPI003C2044A5
MPVSFQDIVFSFEFVGSSPGDNRAILARRTGKIYWRSAISGLDELPDDAEDGEAEDGEEYIAIPDKRELGLGKPLALDFARQCLPDDFDEVSYIFGGRGAYRNFRAFLNRKKALERWYAFEAKATEQALREWCELNAIEVEG